MRRGLQLSAVALLAGAMLALAPLQGLRAATSPAPDILSDDRTPNAVDLGRVKPLARPRVEPAKVLPSGNPLWSVPLSALTATQARPIFSASRGAPAPSARARPAPPPGRGGAPPAGADRRGRGCRRSDCRFPRPREPEGR